MGELTGRGGARIKVLSRARRLGVDIAEFWDGIEIVEGDLRTPGSLRGFLEPGCTVVNLVYLREAGEEANLAVIRHLLEACGGANVRRLIHCSTADVAGRTPDNLITENTPCHPLTEYATTKLKVEELVLDAARDGLDALILRPTAVFGPGSKNLKKLADDLVAGRRTRNYLKSCVFGRRRMNQVHVKNVVDAIIFLAHRIENLRGEVFIVSDDDSPSNNFADIERFFMREFHIPNYRLPRLPFPQSVLSWILACHGKDNINPRRNYDPSKLFSLGFERPIRFEVGLAEYAAWYASEQRGG